MTTWDVVSPQTGATFFHSQHISFMVFRLITGFHGTTRNDTVRILLSYPDQYAYRQRCFFADLPSPSSSIPRIPRRISSTSRRAQCHRRQKREASSRRHLPLSVWGAPNRSRYFSIQTTGFLASFPFPSSLNKSDSLSLSYPSASVSPSPFCEEVMWIFLDDRKVRWFIAHRWRS